MSILSPFLVLFSLVAAVPASAQLFWWPWGQTAPEPPLEVFAQPFGGGYYACPPPVQFTPPPCAVCEQLVAVPLPRARRYDPYAQPTAPGVPSVYEHEGWGTVERLPAEPPVYQSAEQAPEQQPERPMPVPTPMPPVPTPKPEASEAPEVGVKDLQPEPEVLSNAEVELQKVESPTAASADEIPFALPTETAGIVTSPHAPKALVDVTGLNPGSLAVDPTSQKVFRIP